LDAREDEAQSWLVLTGPNGEACAISADRGSVRAQVLQDFMVARTAPAETSELQRLRHIENMALRVASSRRDGIVVDKAVLDKLDAALEAV
jgi:hypothetical protein